MKINTITCHNVYNHGATLQAYGLSKYLSNCGHDIEIIDYRPDYLSNHFKLLSVNNDMWKKNKLTRFLYIILKLPFRILKLKRKFAFDKFSKANLKVTSRRYISNDELKRGFLSADAFICGSDQIWNCQRDNGKDPAFYLDFAPEEKIKISYAASFATESIEDKYKPLIKERIKKLDGISVREKSGLSILDDLNIKNASIVVDPVFLLDKEDWNQIAKQKYHDKYILIYDFDNSPLLKRIAMKIAREKGFKIFSVTSNKLKYVDKFFNLKGPETFVSLIRDAQFILSNSFHAVVFSIIFEKQFLIVNRNEPINTRMKDLLDDTGLGNRLINENSDLNKLYESINYTYVKKILKDRSNYSKEYLNKFLK